MIIKIERVIDVIEEIIPLLVEHWEETEALFIGDDVQPDVNSYLELDAAGVYVMCTARVEGELIGYIGDIVHRSLHTSQLNALNDIMFVNKEHRNTSVFPRMIRCVEDIEKRMGVTERFMNYTSIGPEKKGYKQIERVVRKRLGG